jgi:toxin secretion/phage lysis holin
MTQNGRGCGLPHFLQAFFGWARGKKIKKVARFRPTGGRFSPRDRRDNLIMTKERLHMKENTIKASLTMAATALLSYLGALVVPVIILVGVMLVDYITGMAKAWCTASLSSRTGIAGIVKKVGYLVIVTVGMVLDWVVGGTFARVGVTLPVDFVLSLAVTVWLIINECISILENVAAMGAPVPQFLVTLSKKLKTSVEQSTDQGGDTRSTT